MAEIAAKCRGLNGFKEHFDGLRLGDQLWKSNLSVGGSELDGAAITTSGSLGSESAGAGVATTDDALLIHLLDLRGDGLPESREALNG